MVGFRASCGCALVLALTAVAAHAQTYTAPKTPWGDPDLQNIWSGDSAFGIPMQRPEALGTQAELSDKEFAEKVARDERTRKNALTAVGSFRNDNGWVTKSFRQTSLIVDPANGRLPALVAGRRQAPDADRDLRQRPVQRSRRLHGLRPLPHAGRRRIDDPEDLRQRLPHRAGAWLRRDHGRDDPRSTGDSARRT